MPARERVVQRIRELLHRRSERAVRLVRSLRVRAVLPGAWVG
ncbi:hypothetical protein AB0M10_13610 [Streptomyces sp. NPDC051840]